MCHPVVRRVTQSQQVRAGNKCFTTRCLTPLHHPEVGGPPPVRCPRQFIQHIFAIIAGGWLVHRNYEISCFINKRKRGRTLRLFCCFFSPFERDEAGREDRGRGGNPRHSDLLLCLQSKQIKTQLLSAPQYIGSSWNIKNWAPDCLTQLKAHARSILLFRCKGRGRLKEKQKVQMRKFANSAVSRIQ
jgi:hypothetical protein